MILKRGFTYFNLSCYIHRHLRPMQIDHSGILIWLIKNVKASVLHSKSEKFSGEVSFDF